MEFNCPFIGRDSEINDLTSAFTRKVLWGHGSLAYLVQGRSGVGKTRLIQEFLRRVQDDVLLHADIPAFTIDEHVIVHDCAQSQGKPYGPFTSITDRIHTQQRLLHLTTEVMFLALSVFNVDTILEHLKSIVSILLRKENRTEVVERETLLFNRYRRLLSLVNRKAPLVIFLQHAQKIDIHSLKLLNKVMLDRKPFWGMIVLEDQQDHVPERDVQEMLNRMIGSGDLSRLDVRGLGKDFPSRLLSGVFPEGFFDGGEYELMYAISEGCPGILIDEIEEWKKDHLIEQVGGSWKKCADFKEKIKPKSQKLLELVVALFEDRILTEGEERLIYRMAADWSIPDETVARVIGMARDISDCAFKIVRRIGPGIIGIDSFEVLDDAGSRFIAEYLENEQQIPVSFHRLGIEHANLFQAKEVRPSGKGIIVIWDYREGRRILEVMREARENQIKKSIAMLKQITPAIAELHRVGEAHGYIQPESIIETNDGKFCIAALDPSLLKAFTPALRTGRDSLKYLAPEVLNGGVPDARSDVFALGVLLFNLLTNRYPFEGDSKKDLLESIARGTGNLKDERTLEIPTDIKALIERCLSLYPENRFQNASAFLVELEKINSILTPPPAPPPPPPPPKPRKFTSVIVGAVLVVVLGTIGILWLYREPPLVVDAITVVIKDGPSTGSLRRPLPARAAQFLIVDDLNQSSEELIYSDSLFSALFAKEKRKHVPRLAVRGILTSGENDYELQLKLVSPQQGMQETLFVFHDPSSLLHDMSRITRAILAQTGIHELQPSTFTTNWDAFESFWAGTNAWRKLDVPLATEGFKNALDIDSSFVLAMVRLADVYRFNGQRKEAIELLERARPHLAGLSATDSLRAEALLCRLSGRLWVAIDIYRQIVNRLPGRRSAFYDLAEGYYQLREVEQAAEQYRVAIHLDTMFAPAYNHLGYCYSHLGMHEDALRCFRRYAALDQSANAYDSMGDGFFAAGILDSAIWAKERGIEINPKLGYLFSSLAFIQIRAGKFKEAEANISRYMHYATEQDDKDLLVAGYAVSAYSRLVQGDLKAASAACEKGLRTFDTTVLEARNHQLHWLKALIALRTHDAPTAEGELAAMENIIKTNQVSAKRYNEIYKFWLLLRAHLDAAHGHLNGCTEAAAAFDGPFRSKVKDGGSCFDLAYLNTELGRLIVNSRLGLPQLAEDRFRRALEYNPRYAAAHYALYTLYDSLHRTQDAQTELALFQKQWSGADPGSLPE
jgi:serine/threonine protein kinase/Tfp pilus assembly protein PilF